MPRNFKTAIHEININPWNKKSLCFTKEFMTLKGRTVVKGKLFQLFSNKMDGNAWHGEKKDHLSSEVCCLITNFMKYPLGRTKVKKKEHHWGLLQR